MQPMVVVFPAPFGPSSPNISPGLATKLTSFTAAISPYCFRSCCTSIMLLLQNKVRLVRSLEISDERLNCQDERSSVLSGSCRLPRNWCDSKASVETSLDAARMSARATMSWRIFEGEPLLNLLPRGPESGHPKCDSSLPL